MQSFTPIFDLTPDIVHDSFWRHNYSYWNYPYLVSRNNKPAYKVDNIQYSTSNLLDIFSSNPSTVNMTDTGRGINRIDNFNEPFVQITYPRPQYLAYNYTVEFHNTAHSISNDGLNHWHIMGSNDGEAWSHPPIFRVTNLLIIIHVVMLLQIGPK